MFSTTALSFKRPLLSIATFASLGCVALPASAAVEHIVENGNLMGANNVDVGGTKYDVRFIDGAYNNFLIPSAPNRTPRQTANDASGALLSSVFTGRFNSFPSSTNGCTEFGSCTALTVFNDEFRNFPTFTRSLQIIGAVNYGLVPFEDTLTNIIVVSLPYSTAERPSKTWAVWSFTNVAAIPEPTTYAMMGLGLLGVMGIARRRQQQG